MTSRAVRVSFVCAVVAAMACTVASLPTTEQHDQQVDGSAAGGLGSALWSVLDGCFDDDSTEPATVCLKSKALTALDRAIAKPAVVVANGVSLSSRAGRSLQIDTSAEENDRVVLEAAKDPDHKNALLDEMLARRLDTLVSTKTIVLDGSAVQEGRGKKKEKKAMGMAIMMAGMMAVGVLGPMALKFIALLAAKALFISKIALLLAGIMSFKKIFQMQQSSHPTVEKSHHYYDYNVPEADAHNWAYSGQKQ